MAVSSNVNTPKPIKISPITIEDISTIAKTPVIIRNSVIRVSSRHSSPGILKHFPKQPITSSNRPPTITPMVMKLRGKEEAKRKTPRPIKIRPRTVVATHRSFLQPNMYLTSLV
jgi:hypothetical protein